MMFGLLACLVGNAVAWGGKGHRMIASMAEKRLHTQHPDAAKQIAALLGPDLSLVSIAVCADSIRGFVAAKGKPGAVFPVNCVVTKEEVATMFPSSGSWHFVNIPVPASADASAHPNAVLEQACADEAPCIVQRIEHFTAQLKDKTLDRRTRAIALMFLTHLVGDLHQPLHAVARQKDKGGNDVFIRLGNHTGRLHSIWDTFLVDKLDEADVKGNVAARHTTPKSWAWESYDAARHVVYNNVPVRPSTFEDPIVLEAEPYLNAAMPVVKQRLHAASIRLAALLAKALTN